jgi:hypothetical protein
VAGFVMTLGGSSSEKLDYLAKSASSGVYGTFISPPAGHWGAPQEGTFGDYATMKEGDSIFFFANRHIFGIGELTSISGLVAALNYPAASQPVGHAYANVRAEMLVDDGEQSVNQRWLCFFRPAPAIFKRGVDMDEALESRPEAFRALRQMSGVSFIHVDDIEEQALRDVVLRANLEWLKTNSPELVFDSATTQASHSVISKRVTERHHLLPEEICRPAMAADGTLLHEMALEADILHGLSNRDPRVVEVFGLWDYVTHQVVASPHKPLQWADRMDAFGYSYVDGFTPTIEKYSVAEIKRGPAEAIDIDQVMKYVDWLRDEFANGDYSLIRAFLVASDFSPGAMERRIEVGQRIYTVGRRPAVTETWTDLHLVRYSGDPNTGTVVYADLE